MLCVYICNICIYIYISLSLSIYIYIYMDPRSIRKLEYSIT